MERLFIETTAFTNALKVIGLPELLAELQMLILEDPARGDTIAGTGGLKKMRLADPTRGKGKRGGFRVIYLDLANVSHTHLIYLYGKDEADDLTSDEKKTLKQLVEKIKKQTENL